MVQARTSTTLKNSASTILDELGLNMSTYINMALKQLVLQRGIPFDAKLSSSYTIDEVVDEINATMQMEGLNPTQDELDMIRAYKKGEISADEIRKQILSEV
jgi:addiction module RelB/DinJ family antitoxin